MAIVGNAAVHGYGRECSRTWLWEGVQLYMAIGGAQLYIAMGGSTAVHGYCRERSCTWPWKEAQMYMVMAGSAAVYTWLWEGVYLPVVIVSTRVEHSYMFLESDEDMKSTLLNYNSI